MNTPSNNDKQLFKDFVQKIGYEFDENTLENFELKFQKAYTFLPELAIFAGSYLVRKTTQRVTHPPKKIKNNIRIFFHNIIHTHQGTSGKEKQLPSVRISSASTPQTTIFRQGTEANIVLVIIDADYLRSFLQSDAEKFAFLCHLDEHFLIEEMMTDDILRTVNEIISEGKKQKLKDYFYKLKTLKLLYYLFESLSQRDSTKPVLKWSERDITAIYNVRNAIAADLSQAHTISELKRIAGMNELKMRQLFKQIFGKGIYEYYQHLRMTEAARMLREDKLSVSEAGYALGFENLSHFTRLFEQHIGMKPKKYSSQF
ncbi:helix-turn-helix domain-containing protein [Niabella digestorum]|uniref:AraC family transcriptional regulator n=1 Tax=Niabella digestorum TaxID=3117701 RepID=A0ABU7RJ62_9BACT